MGMYNEVLKKCPYCQGKGCAQIHQIVFGFGGFNLDDPETIADDLTIDQIQELKEAVQDKQFDCQDCGQSFSLKNIKHNQKIKLINSISEDQND